ncbi:MAG: right-handed parallel beta-helix repeat-containing protein [Candidatus Eiseniibacteriota bacterium]
MFARGAGLTLSLGMAAAAATPVEAAEPAGRIFRVTDFGATGNGRTNDTAAFERAFAAAQQAGSGIVEIPAGTYSVHDLWVSHNGNGRRPSLTGVHVRGAGIGATILKHRSAQDSLGCLNMVDARFCSIRDLTVDSSALGDGPQNGGVLLFGCQSCILENLEVRHSSHRSISIAGELFEQGRIEARDTIVRGCIAWGQRVWNGNAAAQIIASDGAKTTQFIDCISEAADGWKGDLFGADDAPGTVFRGCRAYGNKSASAGFWVEEEKGERPAFFTDCSVSDTRNVGIGGEEGAERMFIHNCYFHRVGKNAIRANGVGRVFVDGCFIEECGGAKETDEGAILLQGAGSIQNTRIVNSTAKNAAVNIYTAEPAEPRGFARFNGCTFDKDVFIYQNAAQTVAFEGCTFLDNAQILTYNALKTTVTASNCLFVNSGIRVGGVAQLTVRNSVFRAVNNFAGAAITSGGNSNQLVLADCTFFNYRKIAEDGLVVRAEDNHFENCNEELPAQSTRQSVFSAVMALDGRRAQTIPGISAGNAYVIVVAPLDKKVDGAAFAYAPGSPPVITPLANPASGGAKAAFALTESAGMPALSSTTAVRANVTVIGTTVRPQT